MERFDHHFAYDWLCRFGTSPILSFVLASEVERIAVFLWPDCRGRCIFFILLSRSMSRNLRLSP